jgi:rubrerythrin
VSGAQKVVITGWSALLRCRVCGNEQESRGYGSWMIDSATISHCPVCNRTTNHVVVGRIAEMVGYEEYRSRLQKTPKTVDG